MNLNELIEEIRKSNLSDEAKEYIIKKLKRGEIAEAVIEYLKYLGISKEILELFNIL